jgi:hypothetical protein
MLAALSVVVIRYPYSTFEPKGVWPGRASAGFFLMARSRLMRNSVLLLAIVACLVQNPGSMHAAPSTAVGAEQIAHLISQLGSISFKEREAASQALESIGGPALEALQQAALSNDPEVGRRAQGLARMIRRRIETAQFLVPKQIQLVYSDTPVLKAVEDFAKRTKFPIEIAGSTARLANRRITLDTGETTFWEAFDQFCQSAGLVEKSTAAETDLQANRILLEAALRGQRGLVQMVEAPSPGLGLGRAWDGRLLLVDGKQPLRPTDHAGAVRIRALPTQSSARQTSAETVLFLVEITPQPMLVWHNILDLRIEKALDEDGRDLAPSLETRNDWSQLALAGTGVMLWDTQTGQPLNAPRDIPVRLKSGDMPRGVLKEVKGVFAAQVQTVPQTILAVDNLFKSIGRTVEGDDGESLKLTAAERQPNGNVHVQVELNDASTANVVWAVRRGVLRPNGVRLANGGGRRGPIAADTSNPTTLVLQDADGHSFPLLDQNEDPVINGNILTKRISCTYQPRTGLGEPSKLVYSGRRTMIIEVPFTLKDVPLP